MKIELKPLAQQVVLITGASSGIGRQSALRFAKAGAKVALVARNEEALRSAVAEIEAAGGVATYAVADVADAEQLAAAATSAVAKLGHLTTWVNNAGVGMYTKILATDVVDERRLFETNFWGVVNGSRLAVRHLKASGGGALINLGSEVSDISIPIQGMYATSKHAIRGFTDALRDEILADNLPVSVTLIKPAAINTPFTRHAKNNLMHDATLPPPVYDVDIVADQILHAAVHGGRELYAGGGGRITALLGQHFPNLTDHLMATWGVSHQLTKRPADRSYESLYSSRPGFHRTHGDVDRDRYVQKVSLYGLARRHPLASLALASFSVLAAGLVLKRDHH